MKQHRYTTLATLTLAAILMAACGRPGADEEFPGFESLEAEHYFLEMDGMVVGEIQSVTGGEPVRSRPGEDIATFNYEPVTIEVGMGMGNAFWEWMELSLNGKYGEDRRNGSIIAANFNYESAEQVDLFDMFITEVTFPSLDRALEGETAYMKVGNLTPNIRMNAGSGESYAPHAQEDPRPIEVDRFQLELQGLPDVAGAVASVGEVTIRAASDSEPATAVIAATVPDFMTEMISMSLEPERTQKLRGALVAYSGPIDDQSMVFRMQMAIPQQVVSVDTVGTPGGYKEITFVGDVVDLVFPATELEFDIDAYRDFLKPIAQKIADSISSDPGAILAAQSAQIDDIIAVTGGQDSLSAHGSLESAVSGGSVPPLEAISLNLRGAGATARAVRDIGLSAGLIPQLCALRSAQALYPQEVDTVQDGFFTDTGETLESLLRRGIFDAQQVLTIVDEARFDTGTLRRLHLSESNLALAKELVDRTVEQAKVNGTYEDWGPPTRAPALAEMVELFSSRPDGMDTLVLVEKLEALADELDAWSQLPADQVDNAVLQAKLTDAKLLLDSLGAFTTDAMSTYLDIYGEVG